MKSFVPDETRHRQDVLFGSKAMRSKNAVIMVMRLWSKAIGNEESFFVVMKSAIGPQCF